MDLAFGRVLGIRRFWALAALRIQIGQIIWPTCITYFLIMQIIVLFYSMLCIFHLHSFVPYCFSFVFCSQLAECTQCLHFPTLRWYASADTAHVHSLLSASASCTSSRTHAQKRSRATSATMCATARTTCSGTCARTPLKGRSSVSCVSMLQIALSI